MFKAVANLRDEKGFTLIELLIVVAIIGILAAIAIPGYIGMQERSRKGAVTRGAAAAEQEIAAWMISARKSGSPQGSLREVDTNNDGSVNSSDLTNDALATAGVTATFVTSRATTISPWGGALWVATTPTAGKISISAFPNDNGGIRTVVMSALDMDSNPIHSKTISTD